MTLTKTKISKPVSRSRKSAGKREAIMRAAIEIINAKSFALATMAEIAASMDLRDAALYHYFPDKRALAYACHRASLDRFEKLLHATVQEQSTGADKLRHLIRGMMVDSSKHGPQLYFGDYSYLDAPQRKAISSWAKRLKDGVVRIVNNGMADGSIIQCEPELVVQLLLGMLIWLAKWVPDVEGMTVDRLMNAIDAFCFRGLEHAISPPIAIRPRVKPRRK